ncbi:MAG: hypothetical protein J0J15_20175, partial [Mesorhizobium sp.]|nr:hypothetical protein [Mesorhizobium sp.]
MALVGIVTLTAVITSIRPVRAYIGEDTANLVNVGLATIAALGTATLVIIEFRDSLGGLAGVILLALGIIVATTLFVLAWRATARGGKLVLVIGAAVGTTALVAIAHAWAWGFVWALWAIILFALLAPVLTAIEGQDPFTTHTGPDMLDDFNTPGLPLPQFIYPSAQHWLGVEPGLGRDLFARLAYGAQVSLTIALLATLVSVVLGTILGAAAGFFGGKVDM